MKDKNNMKKHKDRALCCKLSQKHEFFKKKKNTTRERERSLPQAYEKIKSLGCHRFMPFVQSLGSCKAQEMYIWVQLGTKFFWAQFVAQKQVWVTIGLMCTFFMPTLAKHKIPMLSDNFIVVKIQNLKNHKKICVTYMKWFCVWC